MSSVSNRTAYILLSAIEDEFRLIVESFAGDEAPDKLLSSQMLEKAMDRRRRDGNKGTVYALEQLLPYLDFQESFELANSIASLIPKELSEGLKGSTPMVTKVTPVRNRVAHNRPLQIDDLPSVVELSQELQLINGWTWERLIEVQRELVSDPSSIFTVSAKLIIDPEITVANNLPSPDFDETSLLGRKAERRQLMRAIRGSWPVISILGDGGVGKTALALQVCYDLIEQKECQFEAIVWVTAKNSQLTSNEIIRIETTVEDSLGLFASANEAVGGAQDSSNVIEDLLVVLETFPTLLVLDNVETVLDENFHTLLRDIPLGSKVLITSRIGVKTENPIRLQGLSIDDAVMLMQILAKNRGVNLKDIASEDMLNDWVQRMNCHPAYLKWFMSGIQAGQSPEKLLNDNGLVLEFCMSNVYGFLSHSAKSALEAMLVVPGSHTVAELAFLVDFDSSQIQKVVHEITTTNFVTQVRSGTSGTALELSDFAQAYLRRYLSIEDLTRRSLTEKQKQLYTVGSGLKAAHDLAPYSPDTIDVRGVGDYSAAKLLREALDLATQEKYDDALRLCGEAAELAPGYHEASRVEAHIHAQATSFGEAYDAYSRAKDLAPGDAYLAYFFGKFLIDSGFNPSYGLQELQRAATISPNSSLLHLSISEAHLQARDMRSSMEAAVYSLNERQSDWDAQVPLFTLWQACGYLLRDLSSQGNWAQVAEEIEFVFLETKDLNSTIFIPATLDVMLWVESFGKRGAEVVAENYIAKRLAELSEQIESVRLQLDPSHEARRVGEVHSTIDRGFGFVNGPQDRVYFHATDLWDRRQFDQLIAGSVLAYNEISDERSGKKKAKQANWIG